MPLISLSTPGDQFEAFWLSNVPENDLTTIATNGRRTVLIINASRFSIKGGYMDPQLNDAAFQNYNVIALELPGWVGTTAPLLPQQADKYDEWVGAACIGNFCLSMNLKDVHLFGATIWAAKMITRFAALFPSIPQSLSFRIVVADAPLSASLKEVVAEILDEWTHATTRAELEEVANHEVYMWLQENQGDRLSGILDEFINSWSGERMHASALLLPIVYYSQGMTVDEAALVKSPMLVIQGDQSPIFDIAAARDFASHYPNSDSRVHVLAGGSPAEILGSPKFARAIHRLVVAHIENSAFVPSSPSGRPPSPMLNKLSAEEVRARAMQEAMDRYISVAPDWLKNELRARDPQSVLSFSHRPAEVIQELHERWYDRWLEISAASAAKI
ncbi:hypothetical protein DL93DRAFT_2167010 [Clavulina sp. PMI_390]|nr:hypothetical protein DL93DRAFT_2167010 [Clavulina sp. PMI_390]